MNSVIDELVWRGLVHQQTDEVGLRSHLASPRRIYCGFDPTATSLTVGNLVPILLLRHFQRAGHIPVVVLGGATGMIGDPSGKDSERKLLDLAQVAENVAALRPLFSKLLNVGPAPIILNNIDWLSGLSWLEALRTVGKHFSINTMIQKDSVRSRMERAGEGISYTEFSYMLLQAYDFLHLRGQEAVTIQAAGSDQWGNICAGIELIRRVKPGAEAFGLTAPLLTKSDGTKFGKSEAGAIWLDAKHTSAFEFNQFWLNVSDSDVGKYLKALGQLSIEETKDICQRHAANPSKRLAQKALADSLTELVHGADSVHTVKAAASALFTGDIRGLSEAELEAAFGDVPSTTIPASRLKEEGIRLVDFLVEIQVASSKREARTLLSDRAIQVSGIPVGLDAKLTEESVLHNRFLPIRRGKKTWHVVLFDGSNPVDSIG